MSRAIAGGFRSAATAPFPGAPLRAGTLALHLLVEGPPLRLLLVMEFGLGERAFEAKRSNVAKADAHPRPTFPLNESVAKAHPWLLGRGAGKLRFPAPYVFNGLQPPKTAVPPCTAEAVAFCDSLSMGKE